MTTPERQGEDETARRRTHIRPPVERLAYTPAEAAEAMGMGESTIFKLIREGELTAVRYGTRTLVRKEELAAFLDRLEARGEGGVTDDDFENSDYEDDHDEDEWDAGEECGRWVNGALTGSCSKAGSEECDWDCPYSR